MANVAADREDPSNIVESVDAATTDAPAAFLNPEEPLNMLRTIQLLLMNHSSDEVRQILQDQNVFIDDIEGRKLDDNITQGDVLDSPFFVMKGLSEVPHTIQQPGTEGRQMSDDVSKTAREVLADFLSFDVYFVAWTNFAADTAFVGDLPSDLTGYRTWGRLLLRMLDRTFGSKIATTGEIKEMSVLEQHVNLALASFGFIFNPVTGSEYDFEINETDEVGALDEIVVVGEGKESGMLPRLCTEFGHELCWFGFATKIVKAQSRQTKTWTKRYRELGVVLGFTKLQPRKSVDGTASPLVLQLLKQEDPIKQEIIQAAGSVLTRLREGRQEPHDAVNLWAAVMQACLYTVRQGRKMTMVVSARVFWFIRLRTNEQQQCCIDISQGYHVGGQGLLRTLIQFLYLAKREGDMEATEQQMWTKAVQLDVEEDDDGQDQTPGQRGSEDSNESNDNDVSNADADEMLPTKRPKHQNATKLQAAMSDSSDSPPPLTEQNNETAAASTPRHIDKHGVVVPWLHQIGKSLKLLAKGRSGIVTKNMWAGQGVAVKRFVSQEDDDRSFFDVYKHECKVLVKLRSLWGEHIPRLIFRQPWRTSPMIGLQLGEQLNDDMSAWDPVDLEKANETIAKVAALGWVQRDMRGSNFVRLRSGEKSWIAMIDFESVEEIEK